MTRVLLVTGARSLADSRDAERWARAKIAEALAGADLLIVGDADGPDALAREIASEACAERRVYCCLGNPRAGFVVRFRGDERREWRWRHEATSWRTKQCGVTHPLRRNAAMVRDAADLAALGASVTALALLDGRKRGPGVTRGTEHTVGLARKAGLSVREERWQP